MDFRLSDDLLALQDTARRFAAREIAPHVAEDEKNHRFRPEILAKMAELGFFGCVIPEEHGGNGMGWLASVVVTEEIARVSASWGLPFNMQTVGPGTTILRYGTEEQKKKYLPGLVDAKVLGCFAITEPNSGSDVVSMKTTAKKDGDHFVINGSKTWISNAQVADVGLVYAVTDREAKHRGLTCFLVPLKETKGVTSRAIETKLGLHCSPTGELFFEDARVPASSILGKEGDGFKICMSMLDNTRVSCAARAVGVARACFEEAKKYALDRTQFGKRIAEFQMIQADLAHMYVEHEAARFLVWRAASQKDKDPRARNTLEVSMAKYYAAETAVNAANAAMKIFGSYGYSTEYPVERLYRDAKSFQIVEGTSNIQKMIIATNVLDLK
ncbi:MAG: acyl-CoA dehydrogenase family protein [Deltaproteobacteria bacterium]|nr:acyl-CoA dehydrogenase family protein [Deltaproteobacteria bacterium]